VGVGVTYSPSPSQTCPDAKRVEGWEGVSFLAGGVNKKQQPNGRCFFDSNYHFPKPICVLGHYNSSLVYDRHVANVPQQFQG